MKKASLLFGAALTVPLWVSSWASSAAPADSSTTAAPDSHPTPTPKATAKPTAPSPSPTAEPKEEPEVPREAEDGNYIRTGTIYGKIVRPDIPVLSRDAEFFIELRQLGVEDPSYSFYKLQDATKGGQKLPMPYEVEWTIDPWIPKERLKYAISMRMFENGRLTYVSLPQVFNADSKWQRFDLKLVPPLVSTAQAR